MSHIVVDPHVIENMILVMNGLKDTIDDPSLTEKNRKKLLHRAIDMYTEVLVDWRDDLLNPLKPKRKHNVGQSRTDADPS